MCATAFVPEIFQNFITGQQCHMNSLKFGDWMTYDRLEIDFLQYDSFTEDVSMDVIVEKIYLLDDEEDNFASK